MCQSFGQGRIPISCQSSSTINTFNPKINKYNLPNPIVLNCFQISKDLLSGLYCLIYSSSKVKLKHHLILKEINIVGLR